MKVAERGAARDMARVTTRALNRDRVGRKAREERERQSQRGGEGMREWNGMAGRETRGP